MLEKSVTAATAIEKLSETAKKLKEELRPVLRTKERESENCAVMETTMKDMLGPEWKKFEEEAKALADWKPGGADASTIAS